ncbi:hypothetical protein [Saccharopolyspora gregorii]
MSGSDELVTAEDAVAALTAELREGQVFGRRCSRTARRCCRWCRCAGAAG